MNVSYFNAVENKDEFVNTFIEFNDSIDELKSNFQKAMEDPDELEIVRDRYGVIVVESELDDDEEEGEEEQYFEESQNQKEISQEDIEKFNMGDIKERSNSNSPKQVDFFNNREEKINESPFLQNYPSNSQNEISNRSISRKEDSRISIQSRKQLNYNNGKEMKSEISNENSFKIDPLGSNKNNFIEEIKNQS